MLAYVPKYFRVNERGVAICQSPEVMDLEADVVSNEGRTGWYVKEGVLSSWSNKSALKVYHACVPCGVMVSARWLAKLLLLSGKTTVSDLSLFVGVLDSSISLLTSEMLGVLSTKRGHLSLSESEGLGLSSVELGDVVVLAKYSKISATAQEPLKMVCVSKQRGEEGCVYGFKPYHKKLRYFGNLLSILLIPDTSGLTEGPRHGLDLQNFVHIAKESSWFVSKLGKVVLPEVLCEQNALQLKRQVKESMMPHSMNTILTGLVKLLSNPKTDMWLVPLLARGGRGRVLEVCREHLREIGAQEYLHRVSISPLSELEEFDYSHVREVLNLRGEFAFSLNRIGVISAAPPSDARDEILGETCRVNRSMTSLPSRFNFVVSEKAAGLYEIVMRLGSAFDMLGDEFKIQLDETNTSLEVGLAAMLSNFYLVELH